MKKRFSALFLAIVMLFSLTAAVWGTAITAQAAEDSLVIKLHYHRPDGDYTDWSVWFWASGKEGAEYPFAEEDGEMVATYEVQPGDTQIGFIVKLPNWAAKDVEEDQFIDVSAVTSGTVHIYVESGVKGYETVYGEDVSKGTKVSSAEYKNATAISVATTGPVDGDMSTAFTLKTGDREVPITSVSIATTNVYTLTLGEELDLNGSYTLIYDSKEYNVNMPNIYSTEEFESQYTYEGNDLGATWTADKTTFRVWAPTATAVKVNLYKSGTAGTNDLIETIEMTADVNGTWVAEKAGDQNGVYYTYVVDVDGSTVEAVDPYAKTTGVNGKRSMVIDLDSTDPEGWENDSDPNAGISITDAVIYELHVRDLSVDESSGIENKGKYLGLIETGTTTESGIATGLDHIKDLGITHLHILPMYDYGSVDESKLNIAQFNWGYDPVNFNVPEGSYSSDPYNGAVRVNEVKQMVQGLHENGISVVMDVVYNHVYSAAEFCFNQIVPMYFSRVSDTGALSSGSGCGNDTASERSMVRKYIVDSVKYWADEYHIDGFRFDLVGLLDTETINAIIEEVHKTHPNVIFYGEGWSMSTIVTKDDVTLCTQTNSAEVPEFSFFNDTIRDLLKGSVFDTTATGYVSGAHSVKSNLEKCFSGTYGWATNPTQTVNYVSCHDNNTLIDRITLSTPDATREDQVKMNNLAAAFYMTSQGVPFMQAGEEMLRSKPTANGGYDHNSYSSSDEVNSIKWDNLDEEEFLNTYNYYKGLIAFRKAHPSLRLTTKEEAQANITSFPTGNDHGLAFQVKGVEGDNADSIFVIFNADTQSIDIDLPEGSWNIYVNSEKAGTEILGTAEGTVTVDAISAMVLVQEAATEAPAESGNLPAILAGVAAAAAAVAGVVVALRKKKK